VNLTNLTLFLKNLTLSKHCTFHWDRLRCDCQKQETAFLWATVCPEAMRNALRETQTLHAGCSKAEPKKFAPLQTPFLGAQDGQNLVSWRGSLPLPTNPVSWRSMHAISSYRANRPKTNKQTHKQTHKQTGPITIHCAVKLSPQCNKLELQTPDNRNIGLIRTRTRCSIHSVTVRASCRATRASYSRTTGRLVNQCEWDQILKLLSRLLLPRIAVAQLRLWRPEARHWMTPPPLPLPLLPFPSLPSQFLHFLPLPFPFPPFPSLRSRRP